MVRTTPLQSSRAPAICRPCMPACSANAQTGVSQMTTCWFNLISWPVKPVCKFSSLFGNYAKGEGKWARGHLKGSSMSADYCWLLLIIVDYCGVRHQLAHHVTSYGHPASSLKHSKLFSLASKTEERTRRPLTIRRFSGSHFPCKMQRGPVETADYINLASGQTWRGEISIIWHWPQMVTLPSLELG